MIFYSFFFWNEYANLRIKSIFVIWSPWGYNRLLYDKLPLNFSVVLCSKAMVVNDKISSFKNEWFRGLKYIASWCEIRKPLTSILEIYCLSSIETVLILNFKFLKYTLYTYRIADLQNTILYICPTRYFTSSITALLSMQAWGKSYQSFKDKRRCYFCYSCLIPL